MAVVPLILRNWKLVLGGLVVLGLSIALAIAQSDARHWRKLYDQEASAHKLDVANVKRATAEAHAADLKHAADVRTRDDLIERKNQDAIESQLADARATIDAYARRMRLATAAAQGSGGGAGSGAAPDAPGGADDAGKDALVPATLDDLEICAENTVKALGWRQWWAEVSSAPR